ncbi:MAG TPA: mechanosensitive ion channel domain-containing protein [Dermatophilaceae bacterium]|nr:mechanosensitive ion channel domain-containing protein [Dermatophilaceae bacterium]
MTPIPIDLPPITPEGLLLGLAAVVTGLVLASLARRVVTMVLRWRGRGPASATVFGRVAGWVCVFLGLAAALTIAFPSVKPVNILGGVGVVSIAAGIAFQTVLGNMFAGLVLLGRDKYRIDDQVEVTADERIRGTITEIGLTATAVRTFDGRLVLLPNSLLHSKAVTVQTGYERIRSTVVVSLAADTDLVVAKRVALEAIDRLPQIHSEPAPKALLTEVTQGGITMELRFWSGSTQLETNEARDAVIDAVLASLRTAAIAFGDDIHKLEPGPWLQRWLTGWPGEQPHDPGGRGTGSVSTG